MNTFKHFFHETSEEVLEWREVHVSGKVPTWLQGQLLRIGPGRFQAGREKLHHWFDGFAHLFSLRFSGSTVAFKNAFLRTHSFKESEKKKKNAGFMLATTPAPSKYSLFRLLRCMLPMLPQRSYADMDNTNVNFVPNKNGTFTALTETTQYIEFDRCLNTLGAYRSAGLSGQVSTAHPAMDEQQSFNLIVEMNVVSRYRLFRESRESEKREQIALFWRMCPSYFHSLAHTKHYLIVIEQPLKIPIPLMALLLPFSFLQHFFWMPFLGTRLHVIRKKDGKKMRSFRARPFYFFHIINAFEKENGQLVLTLPTFDDASILKKFLLKNLEKEHPALPAPRVSRFEMNLETGNISETFLGEVGVELPRINERFAKKEHRFCYGIATLHRSSGAPILFDRLGKIDLFAPEKSIAFAREHCFFGEPIFVPRPGGKKEDDGLVLGYGLNAKTGKNFVLGLGAKNMEELFYAELPVRVTAGFHGGFVGE